MRLHEIILEIKELKQLPTHKSTMDIFRLLDNNRKLFLERMEAGNFDYALRAFEELSNKSPKEYNTPGYIRDYEQAHASLSFYLDRII